MKNKPPNKKARLEVFQPVESPVSKAASSSASASTSASSSIAHSPSTQQGLVQSTSTSFPALNVLDLTTLPQITHLISQKASEIQIPSMEDVDQLQTELETMWSSLSFRLRLLQREQANLQNNSIGHNNQSSSRHTDSIHFNAISKVLGEDFDLNHSQEKINAVATIIDSGHGTRTSVSAAAKLVMSTIQPASPSSSSSSSTRKSGNVKTFDNKVDKQSKKKVKFEPQSKRGAKEKEKFAEKDGTNCQPLEAPNIFWDFANTYCKEITKEDLAALEKLIEDEKNIPDSLFQIPPLGKPQRESSTSTSSAAAAGNNNSNNLPIKDVYGPLTQKLVTALVDDRMSAFNNQQLCLTNGTTTKDDSERLFISRPDLVKAIGLDTGSANSPGSIQMETRLRQFLSDQALHHKIDEDDEPTITLSNDEVHAEIEKTQNTLKKLQQHNLSKLMELYNCGKREIERASIRRDLDKCDREIQEGYKNSILGKIKKKPLTTKEKEVIFKALTERNALIKSLK